MQEKGGRLKKVKKKKSTKQVHQTSRWSNVFSKIQGTNLSKATGKTSTKPTLRPSTTFTLTTTPTTSLIPMKVPSTIGQPSSLVSRLKVKEYVNRSKVNHLERQQRRLKRTEQQRSALHRQVRSRLSRMRTVVTELVAKSRMALRKRKVKV